MIVTIDGPAGSGKSTAARRLAQRLEFEYLDTGAMYRAVAWYCLHQSVDPSDAAGVSEAARSLQVRLKGETVMANDVDVTEAIRSPHITQAASLVATHPAVRSQMVCEQRRLARNRNIVVEGRDQGTVVFPNAECKFFLVADATETCPATLPGTRKLANRTQRRLQRASAADSAARSAGRGA